MKQFLSSALSKAKELLSSVLGKAKQALPPILEKAKQALSALSGKVDTWLTAVCTRLKLPLTPRVLKFLLLALVLLLVLIIGLTRCDSAEVPAFDPVTGTVAVNSLPVHKKPKESSRVLGQLPLELEVEILEEQTTGDILWGRVDEMSLPDGKTVKGGWVDLQCIDFEPDPVPEATEPEPEPEPTILISMGTVTAGKLNIRKGPGSNYDADGAYYKGDRVEILETKTVEDTVWGRTDLGWIGTGYVRMDGTPIENVDSNLITDNSSTVLGYGIVMLGELNVRLGPDTIYGKSGTIARGSRYAYYQLQDGWARIESGWVSTEHFYLEGTTTADAFPGIVNTAELNIRTGPKSTYLQIGTYRQGDAVTVLAKIGDWGCTDKGWIFLEYVDTNYSTGNGTITNGLNIRQEPNAQADIVGTYTTGDYVTVLEVNGNWGRTDLGWINLKYVAYD